MKKLILLLFVFQGIQAQEIDKIIQIKNDSISYYQHFIKALQSDIEELKLEKLRKDLNVKGMPKIEAGEELINHKAFSLVYSEKHEQAKWVAHIITQDVITGIEGRTNDFRPDPLIKTGSSVEEDYFLKELQPDGVTYKYDGFGFDRGHLAPSADFRWSNAALSESYFYSNMSPQRPDFNRDSWAKLEDLLRAYIYNNPGVQLYIVTGPVLKDSLPKVKKSKNKVSIPEKFFKTAVDLTNNRAIAFVMPNKQADFPHEYYALSIDSVESLTGIDFYVGLDDVQENFLESQSDYKPFLPKSQQDDIMPEDPENLPRNAVNTLQAKIFSGKGDKVNVVGTVVSTKMSSKGNVFLNLDKKYPNQIFTITIFKDNMINFSYSPDVFLAGKKIMVRGVIKDYNGVPSMIIENEKAIEILEE
ncbi:MAG: hypothetical protein A2W91_03865 [Bacteroidetes bacterium GWF2_38_335]|nr:MAG: hypothetical protein A2W91_03865 [Bacteroidetes bacterium GWF2_38_335]OFY79089.1 MAG: hypothetical protein A2281_03200 [Bacteroidetes bacterium RIFOXYA12_FULL_38_20]HBS88826.1 DNA/RNA non-specific endonuclease [Bacteroidales bacterium]